ncbi:LGFP repeat-containing protein [Rhodococcus sp. SGAir0479]|uniref:LGFP repeat-containing protein n=1 Tax=Rhodococcus sp. SGAir0479 TaxID=2567884 RepID=UPI0020C7AB08|nr:hypothetical protein [Rhodococcus sp. SGAir0479]
MGVLVELPHPVSAESAKSLISPSVTALVVSDENLVGEFFVRPGESPSSAVESLKSISSENFGTQLRVSGVRIDSDAAGEIGTIETDAAELPVANLNGAVQAKKPPAGVAEETPQSRATLTSSPPGWAPSRVSARAFESANNGVTFNQSYYWDDPNAPTLMPDEWGFELEFGLRNETISGNHPLCADGTDDNFWAGRGTSSGEVRFWSAITASTPVDGKLGAYFDGTDTTDNCSRLGFDIGIGYPKNIKPSGMLIPELVTTIVTDRGTQPSSIFWANAQTVENDCPFGPASWCMNLTPNAFPGPGSNSSPLFSESRKKYVQGGFEYNYGVPTYIANCTITGAFGVRYLDIGGGNGPLGRCDSPEYVKLPGLGQGRAQDFLNGKMYWTAGTGGWETYGAIGDKYESLGGPSSALGWPTSGELGTPNGLGRFNRFQNGNIYFGNPVGRAHMVIGAIFARYGQEGYEGGRFGFPTSDEFVPDNNQNLRQVNFEHGWIRFDFSTGQTYTS